MSTFKTEVPNFERALTKFIDPDVAIRLPASVNLIALRESFLSEAPFVSGSNMTFWRRMVDGRCFQQLLSTSYHIISDCVAENSAVDLSKLNNVEEIQLIPKMASNLAEMYYVIKLREREIFFQRLPEVLAFMVVSAIRTSIPKHHRLCQSTRFREILLDWYCEVLGGFRFSNCRTNREWFFADLSDAPILTTSSSNQVTSTAMMNQKRKVAGVACCKHQVSLSPLINMYTGDSKARQAELGVNLSLSYSNSRPLTSLPIMPDLPRARVRQQTVDYALTRKSLRQSQLTRRKILNEHADTVKQAAKDIRKYKVNLDKTLSALTETSAENIVGSCTLP